MRWEPESILLHTRMQICCWIGQGKGQSGICRVVWNLRSCFSGIMHLLTGELSWRRLHRAMENISSLIFKIAARWELGTPWFGSQWWMLFAGRLLRMPGAQCHSAFQGFVRKRLKKKQKETVLRSLVSGVRCALTVLHASGQATLSREGNWTIPDCQATLGTFRHTPRDVESVLIISYPARNPPNQRKEASFNVTKIMKGPE